jgi:hypothetical protein
MGFERGNLLADGGAHDAKLFCRFQDAAKTADGFEGTDSIERGKAHRFPQQQ